MKKKLERWTLVHILKQLQSAQIGISVIKLT